MSVEGWRLAALGVALGLSFLFSGMEAGVFALSRLRIRQRVRAGERSAQLLYGFLQNPEDFLWTILVGNTVANFAAVSLTVVVLHDRLAGQAAWLGVCGVVAVCLIYAVADLLPKMLFRQYPNRLSLALARPFGLIHLVLAPAVALVAWLTDLLLRFTGGRRFEGRLFGNRDELRWIMQESGGELTKEERTMVNRVLDLQNLTVTAIGRPLERVVTTTTQTPMSEVFRVCRETGLNRLPVREPHSGRIVGILTLRNALYREQIDERQVAGTLLQPATFVDDTMRIEEVLRRLRETGQRLAIVLDRNRQEVGIVTLHDILRFLFGEVSL
jgi:CBS domain containing-hemolysin-like protein